MKIFYHVSISQGHSLPKFSFVAYTLYQLSLMKYQAASKRLTGARVFHYPKTTKAKSLVGIGLPFYTKAHRRQHLLIAGFFMRTICLYPFVISLGKLYQNYGGLIEGAKAHRILCGGKTNLDQSTTLKIGLFGGGLKNHTKEASIMLTTPSTNTPISMVYTFLISLPNKKVVDIKKPRFVSVSAKTEAQARTILNGLPLVFIKRTPANTQEVAA